MATLNLTSLRCNRKRDITGKDEPRLTVNDEVVWGGGGQKIEKGQTIRLGLEVDFEDVANVRLDEMNSSGDDPHQIGSTVAIRVDRPGSPVEFGTSGAHYELHYFVS
jgi:hypothetical protein